MMDARDIEKLLGRPVAVDEGEHHARGMLAAYAVTGPWRGEDTRFTLTLAKGGLVEFTARASIRETVIQPTLF